MNPSKIISRIYGGLGNQLFIYATSRRLAIINDAELILDSVSGFKRDFTYERHYQLHHFNIPCRKALPIERFEPFSRIRRYIKKTFNKFLEYDNKDYICNYGARYDIRLLNLKFHRTLYLEGYWQSEKYFKDIEDIIRKDLKIIPPDDLINKLIANNIQGCTAVGLHVRNFDKISSSKNNNLLKNYYELAIQKIEIIIESPHYFVFSDDLDYAKKSVNFPQGRFTFIDHNKGDEMAYADLWLMSLCKHFIVANSTFSWWGAWLSNNNNKIVIAPSPSRFNDDNFWRADGLLPLEWILI